MNSKKCSPFNFELKFWCFGFKIFIFIKLILFNIFENIIMQRKGTMGIFICTQYNEICFVISNFSTILFHIYIYIYI